MLYEPKTTAVPNVLKNNLHSDDSHGGVDIMNEGILIPNGVNFTGKQRSRRGNESLG